MNDEGKTKEQLIQELVSLRREIATLQASETKIGEKEVKTQESQEKYRVLIDNAGEGILVVQDGMVVYANPHVMKVTGYSLEELSSKLFVEFIHPDDREMVIEYHINRLKGEKVAPVYSFRNIDKEGNIRWAEANVVTINWDGIPASLIFIKDINEQKKAEKALKESEEKYSMLVEQGNDGIVILQDGLLKFANSKMAEITGFSLEEELETPFIDFVAPEYKELVMERYKKRMAGDEVPYRYEAELLSKNGMRISVEINVSRVEYAGRSADMAIIRDITERKQAEKALRKSEERYRALVENINDVIFTLDCQGRFTYISPVIEQLFHYKTDEIIGQHFSRFVHSEDLPDLVNSFDNTLAGQLEPFEFRVLNKEGSVRYILTSSRPLLEEGQLVGLTGIMTDITERKLMEQKLKDYTENLEKLVEERTTELKESELQYRTTIDSMGDMIHVVDSDLRFILFNRAFKQLNKELGMETDVIGKKLIEVFNFLPDNVLEEYYQVFDTGETLITEGSITLRDKEFITETRKIPIFSEGKVTQIVTVIRDITERKQAGERIKEYAESLKETEARYRGLYESSIDGIISTDLKGNIVEVNQVVAYRLGYSMEELYTLTFYDVVPSKWHNKVLEIVYGKIFTQGYSDEFEIEAVRKDGITFPISVRMWLIKDKEDNPTGIWGIVRDITERKLAEDALKESERRLKEGQQVANFGNWDWNIETNELFWSDQIYKIFGLQPQEFGATYDAFLESVHPEDRGFVQTSVNDALWKKKLYDIDHRIALPDGSMRFVHEKAKVFYDEPGNPIRMLGTVQDITERKQAEEALQESEERYRRMADNIQDGLTLIENGKVVYANDRACEIFGYPKDEYVTKSGWDLAAPEEKERLQRVIERVHREDVFPNELEYWIIRKDGSRRCVRNRYSYSRKGETVTRLVITSDITERKKLDQMKSQFINVAAHELRTPLSALKAHVDLLKIKSERGYWHLPIEVTEKLNVIARNADRLTVLTNNLLDYTRLEAGTVKMKLESNSLDTIIVQVIEEVLPLVKKRRHKIDLITPEMLIPLEIDKELIHRVFSNLITNAIKYTPDEGKIDVKIVEDDENLHITVKDTGIGIPRDDLENIFQPFQVTDIPESARFQSEFERTGLGLAISREYVKMHGGSIWAESRLGEGSTFHVVLPKKSNENRKNFKH
ncbi:MAG: PAS domain S-box protein [Promethearchaeota archaeon]